MRIIIKKLTPEEPEGERERLRKVTTGTLKWTPMGWEVEGAVWLDRKGLEKIPYRFHRVDGIFDVSMNKLTSLAGSPRFVGGSFHACYNRLTDLTGAPETVGGNCVLSHNRLRSTRGIPKEIGRDLHLHGNPSLTAPEVEGLPGVGGKTVW